jgi:hypothetical protein
MATADTPQPLTIAITATGLRVLHAAPAPDARAEPHAPLAGDG